MPHNVFRALGASAAFTLVGGAAMADALADFQAAVDAAWTEAALQPGVQGVSNTGSDPLQESKSIGAACLGSQITACVQWWAELQQIATLTGWTVTEYDGKIDVATWNEQLTRAAEAGHDGILTFGAIPSISGQGLGAIAATGLPVVGMTSDDPEGVATLTARVDGGIRQDNFEVGFLQGVAAYTLGNGKLNAIGGYDGSEISVARREGFESFIAECVAAGGDCQANPRQTDTAQMFQQIGQYCSSLVLAALLGATTGVRVVLTRASSLIVSLGMMILLRGASEALTEGRPITIGGANGEVLRGLSSDVASGALPFAICAPSRSSSGMSPK
jgi:ABC-type sugar transport system substrate-binding protein